MRKLAIALTLASLGLTTACSGDTAQQAESAVESAGAQASSAAGEAADAAGDAAQSASPDASASGGSGAGGQTLTATVGEEGDADAFVINLTDASGQKVTSLPAGEYTIEVSDPSTIHNFHLTGAGGVDETTTVPETGETSWTVTLAEGDYTYICDPHPRMVGNFTVTA